ncbi:MAG: hypothetical protein CMB80_10735 [Flammeovirgaceae bacterium]|nr:hypothetical protein [Flammeovirgaceae bacterium]
MATSSFNKDFTVTDADAIEKLKQHDANPRKVRRKKDTENNGLNPALWSIIRDKNNTPVAAMFLNGRFDSLPLEDAEKISNAIRAAVPHYFTSNNDEKDKHMKIATWQLPAGLSADKNANMIKRMAHYRFKLVHKLNDGTRVIPTIETMRYIFQAYDDLNVEVAVDSNSYTLYVD